MTETATPTPKTPRHRRPDTAPDPTTLTDAEYVKLQIDRSKLMAGENYAFRAMHLFEQLQDHIGAEAFEALESILCVGCRNGHELDAAESIGFAEVVGIDLHSLDPRIRVMDMQQMDFADGTFDVVLACHVLEHAKDPGRAGAELRRVTKAGGYMLVEVPIYYGTRGADLWDYESPERVLALLGDPEPLVAEEGKQLDGPQEVARVIARVPGLREL